MSTAFFGGSFFGGEFFSVAAQQFILVGGGDGMSWQDHVKAKSDLRNARFEIKEQKKELAKVERKIVAARIKVKNLEKPEGILANLWKLEERKTRIKERIYEAKQEFMQLSKLIESLEAHEEIDEDDEEILTIQ